MHTTVFQDSRGGAKTFRGPLHGGSLCVQKGGRYTKAGGIVLAVQSNELLNWPEKKRIWLCGHYTITKLPVKAAYIPTNMSAQGLPSGMGRLVLPRGRVGT